MSESPGILHLESESTDLMEANIERARMAVEGLTKTLQPISKFAIAYGTLHALREMDSSIGWARFLEEALAEVDYESTQAGQ